MASPEDKAAFDAGIEVHMNEILAVLALGGPMPEDEGSVTVLVEKAKDAMYSRRMLEFTVGEEATKFMKAEAINRLGFLAESFG